MELQGEGPFVPWELTICAVKKGPTAILYLGEGFEGFLALLSAPPHPCQELLRLEPDTTHLC